MQNYYLIYKSIDGPNKLQPFKAYCDVTTDRRIGITVINHNINNKPKVKTHKNSSIFEANSIKVICSD